MANKTTLPPINQIDNISRAFNISPNSTFWNELTDIIADKVTTRVIEVLRASKPRYYGRKEVAKMLHISLPTLARLMNDGILIGKNVGGRILYDADTIDMAVSGKTKFSYLKKGENHPFANANPKPNDAFSSSPTTQSRKQTYLILDEKNGCVKIGISRHPKVRERTLQSEKPFMLLYKVCDENIEAQLHEEYSEKRIRGEWFKLSEQEIVDICTRYKFHDP